MRDVISGIFRNPLYIAPISFLELARYLAIVKRFNIIALAITNAIPQFVSLLVVACGQTHLIKIVINRSHGSVGPREIRVEFQGTLVVRQSRGLALLA